MTRQNNTSLVRPLLLAAALAAGLSVSACQGNEPAADERPTEAPATTEAESSSDIVSTMDAETGEVVFDTSGTAPARDDAAEADQGSAGDNDN